MADLGREQFEEYFTGLGMGAPLIERGLSVIESVERLLTEPIRYLFVSEYRDEGGNRNFESLWILTEGYMSESQGFLTGDRFDIVPVHQGLVRLETNREHFDFVTATDQSRLSINISFPPSGSTGLSGNFKASGENCTALVGVLQGYLLPLLEASG
jgi:hypothetical protein